MTAVLSLILRSSKIYEISAVISTPIIVIRISPQGERLIGLLLPWAIELLLGCYIKITYQVHSLLKSSTALFSS
jgi:hypothetical protein